MAAGSAVDELRAETEAEDERLAQTAELRYTGWDDWVVYGKAAWEQERGDLAEQEVEVLGGGLNLARDTRIERDAQKYVFGANWYPRAGLHVAGQYYFRRSDNSYTHRTDSTDNAPGSPSVPGSVDRFPAFLEAQDLATHDANLRVTWRARDDLRLGVRYDWQRTRVDSLSDALADVQSAEITSHLVGASASWNPTAAIYVQSQVNYVDSVTETPAGRPGGRVSRFGSRLRQQLLVRHGDRRSGH